MGDPRSPAHNRYSLAYAWRQARYKHRIASQVSDEARARQQSIVNPNSVDNIDSVMTDERTDLILKWQGEEINRVQLFQKFLTNSNLNTFMKFQLSQLGFVDAPKTWFTQFLMKHQKFNPIASGIKNIANFAFDRNNNLVVKVTTNVEQVWRKPQTNFGDPEKVAPMDGIMTLTTEFKIKPRSDGTYDKKSVQITDVNVARHDERLSEELLPKAAYTKAGLIKAIGYILSTLMKNVWEALASYGSNNDFNPCGIANAVNNVSNLTIRVR